MIVLRSTYNALEAKHKVKCQEVIDLEGEKKNLADKLKSERMVNAGKDTTIAEKKAIIIEQGETIRDAEANLKAEQSRRDKAENMLKKAESDIERLKQNIKNYNEKLVSVENQNKELTAANKTLFARAGGLASSYKNMQMRILESTSLKGLKKHVEKSMARKEAEDKNKT